MSVTAGETALVWFENDLRLHDHAALDAACRRAQSLIALYVLPPPTVDRLGFPRRGPFRDAFLLQSLRALDAALQALGQRLWVVAGLPEQVIPAICRAQGVDRVYAHHEHAWEERHTRRRLATALAADGVATAWFWGNSLYTPDELPWADDALPDVFSSFRKRCEKHLTIAPPLAVPHLPPPTAAAPDFVAATAELIGTTATYAGQKVSVTAAGGIEPADPRAVNPFLGGEAAGKQRLDDYFWKSDRLKNYKYTRNGLLGEYSSKFSPWLALGCLSPRWIVAEVQRYERERTKNVSTYWMQFELMWRDYFRHIFRKHDRAYFFAGGIDGRAPACRRDRALFQRWCDGTTGVPFIDANMLELARTGFMSNRGRQVVASFLVRDLKLPWTWGARYFESLLIDYDVYSNWGNWAYVAGVGNDPRRDRYFHPIKQAHRYDGQAAYVHTWLPQLAHLSAADSHQPHQVPKIAPPYDQPLAHFERHA